MSEPDDDQAAAPSDPVDIPEEAEAEAEAGGVAFIEPDPLLARALQQVYDLEARLRTVSAAFKQQQDDTVQVRARLERQALMQREVQRGELVATLFEPLENLRRSIQSISQDETVTAEAKEGLAHVSKQFLTAFASLGLEETGRVGVLFDPNQHEAIGIIPVTDPDQDETIVEVFSVGYRIGARLLLPAKVMIGKVEEPAGED